MGGDAATVRHVAEDRHVAWNLTFICSKFHGGIFRLGKICAEFWEALTACLTRARSN